MEPGFIEESILPGGGNLYSEWGANLDEYNRGQHTRYNASTEINKLGVKLFSADLKSFYNDSSRFSSSYCFYRVNSEKVTRKLKLSEVAPSYLKYFLTDNFLNSLKNSTGDKIVEKFGTHVLSDILLGGVSSIIFNAKMTTTANESSFKKEADLYSKYFTAGTGSTEAQSRFKNFKDVSITIKTYGGKAAINTSISFDPIKGEMAPINIDLTDWLNSVDITTEQIIGIGDNTTEIHFISDFVDDSSKKKEIEDAIVRYCEKQRINMNTMQTLDYELGVIYYTLTTNNKQYILAAMDLQYVWQQQNAYINRLPVGQANPWDETDTDAWRLHWTFYPYGEYYRIGTRTKQTIDYALVTPSSSSIYLPRFSESSTDQLWAIEGVPGQKDKYMLKHVNSGLYFCTTDHKLHPRNPNDQSLWLNIVIPPK